MKKTTKQFIAGAFVATVASLVPTNVFAQDESLATVNAANLNIRQRNESTSKKPSKYK